MGKALRASEAETAMWSLSKRLLGRMRMSSMTLISVQAIMSSVLLLSLRVGILLQKEAFATVRELGLINWETRRFPLVSSPRATDEKETWGALKSPTKMLWAAGSMEEDRRA